MHTVFVKLSVFEKVDLSWLTPPLCTTPPRVNIRTLYEKAKGQERNRWHWEKLPLMMDHCPVSAPLGNIVISGYRKKAGESLWYMTWSPSNQSSPANQRLIPLNDIWGCLRRLQVPALPRCWSKVFTLASGLTCFYFGVVCSGSDHQIMRLSARRASLWHWSVVTWCLGLHCTSFPRYHTDPVLAEACTDPCWPKSATDMFSSWLSALNPIIESVTYDFNVIR